MKNNTVLAGALALAMLAGARATAVAEEGKHWYFSVHNASANVVNEFRTQEDGEWSENWLSTRLEPGDEIKLDFETNEGDCVIRTQVNLVGGAYFDAPVDYCKASTLEIQGDTLIWK